MCGIVGCVGAEHATEFVLDGLETLEYRGYDSAGIGLINQDNDIEITRTVGGVEDLRNTLPSNVATLALGHTRWATHGGVSENNAHPHLSPDRSIAVVHNGVIENHEELKNDLINEGYKFSSQTDTEVIPVLAEYHIREGKSPEEAMKLALSELVGTYAVLATFKQEPTKLYAARLGSPLVIGVDDDKKSYYAASDPSVLIDHTQNAHFLEDFEVAILSPEGAKITNLKDGKESQRKPELLSTAYEKAILGDFPHWMLKEIHDSPSTVRSAISGRVRPGDYNIMLGGLAEVREQLRTTERFILLGCGTSYHAGLVGERLIEELAEKPVEVRLASDFKHRKEPFEKNTAAIALSQSGETTDTIQALEKAGRHGMLQLGIINTPGSAIDRMTQAGIHCRAGKEISVASTKAFTSQVTVMAEAALYLGNHSTELHKTVTEELLAIPNKIEEILANADAIKEIAQKYANYKNFMYTGRDYEYASALEGALKLKEITYINAFGCEAGEMKHGTLALIDENFPTMAIATDSEQYEKTISNIQEIKARGGPVIALANEGNSSIGQTVDDTILVPKTAEQLQPILNGVALQLFAYHVAVEKGVNIDRPRNLAKSVTVE